eukprot:gnl/MRDRNA2_/MRDRNA2_87042_c0_seq1.p1 gnl/MRDRNA2_/MRDRNA2_87042_c0~~gnl/MRDRNA2_/MRDRNA2_87042_c0_seq1.p1  ORF type:complete len:138 (-),score=23.49 gnl/MRDRNA2_/MRDRNA2_87042_c0_seq1:41-454(-)
MFRTLCLVLGFSLAAGVSFLNTEAVGCDKPKGAGQPEETKDCACSECSKHEQYIKANGDECFCHATDVMGTFENDATKESTKKVGTTGDCPDGATHCNKEVTSNIGAARLPEGWMWHCRPITSSENPQGDAVWQSCK